MLIADRPPSGYVLKSSDQTPRTTPVMHVGVNAPDELALLGRLSRVASLPKAPNGTNFERGTERFELGSSSLPSRSASTLFDFDFAVNGENVGTASESSERHEDWGAFEAAVSFDSVAAHSTSRSKISFHKPLLFPAQRVTSSTVGESFINLQIDLAQKLFRRLNALIAPPMPSKQLTPQSGAQSSRGALGSLLAMRDLIDDWDGEGAPRPSDRAIARAGNVLSLAQSLGLTVTEVDPDVLGGVAIWLVGTRSSATAWVSLMNNDSDTLVLTDNGKVSHNPWGAQTWARLAEFLGSQDERSGV